MGVTLLVVLVSASIPAAEPTSEQVKAELKKLEGQWLVVLSQHNDKKYHTGNEHWVIVGDLAKVHLRPGNALDKTAPFVPDQGNLLLTYHLKLDPSKSPKTMDQRTEYKMDKNISTKPRIAIYKLEGDSLTICYAGYYDKGKYPGEFSSEKDSDRSLIVLKREKK
jgi:uncharacterized protein (TIGR03067 family)